MAEECPVLELVCRRDDMAHHKNLNIYYDKNEFYVVPTPVVELMKVHNKDAAILIHKNILKYFDPTTQTLVSSKDKINVNPLESLEQNAKIIKVKTSKGEIAIRTIPLSTEAISIIVAACLEELMLPAATISHIIQSVASLFIDVQKFRNNPMSMSAAFAEFKAKYGNTLETPQQLAELNRILQNHGWFHSSELEIPIQRAFENGLNNSTAEANQRYTNAMHELEFLRSKAEPIK